MARSAASITCCLQPATASMLPFTIFSRPNCLKWCGSDGYPLLGPGFESSLPGLHFLGATAARSFGPVSRFVSGTTYAARALTRRIHWEERA